MRTVVNMIHRTIVSQHFDGINYNLYKMRVHEIHAFELRIETAFQCMLVQA